MCCLLQTEEAKSFDIWAFKKALLSTLLQAVKAIKGQIIKAKGHILTKKGQFISAKGEAISNFGKHVASTALNLDGSKSVPDHPPAPPHPAAHSSGYSSGPSGPSGKLEITGTLHSVPKLELIAYFPFTRYDSDRIENTAYISSSIVTCVFVVAGSDYRTQTAR
jgi:hypothetical protein